MVGKTNADVSNSGLKTSKLKITFTSDFEPEGLIGTIFTVQQGTLTTSYTWMGNPMIIEILPHVECSVTISDISGYYTANLNQTLEALLPDEVAEISFSLIRVYMTTIKINQTTITDPDTMIEVIKNDGGIEKIRENSHRYTGTYDTSNKRMRLKQLDDNDGTKYLDGSTATLTTTGTDVWMKLPKFYFKTWGVQNGTKGYDLYMSVSYGAKPDDTFYTWEGKSLIGVYKAYRLSRMAYSKSDVIPEVFEWESDIRESINNRNISGLTTITWMEHCMLTRLFYLYYKTTNSRKILGNGRGYTSSVYYTGVNNAMGMRDTLASVNGTNAVINFWGLEDWFGSNYVTFEVMSNAYCEPTIWGNIYLSLADSSDSTYREINPQIVSFSNSDFHTVTSPPRQILTDKELHNIHDTNKSNATSSTGYCDVLTCTETLFTYDEITNETIEDSEGNTYSLYDYYLKDVLLRGYDGVGGTTTSCSFSSRIGDIEYGWELDEPTRLSYIGDYIIEA